MADEPLKTLKELKSLKEMVWQVSDGATFDKNLWIRKADLRAEAIRHARRLKEAMDKHEFNNLVRIGNRGALGMEQLAGAYNWVVGTFNLTEEDLK